MIVIIIKFNKFFLCLFEFLELIKCINLYLEFYYKVYFLIIVNEIYCEIVFFFYKFIKYILYLNIFILLM